VDPLTHGLASFTLQRAFFPRASWRAVVAIVAAGVLADVDWFSTALGPTQFVHWHRSATHSLAFVLVLALAAAVFFRQAANGRSNGSSWLAVALAGLLHLAFDVLQPDSVSPLWPFSSQKVALDLLPNFDLWLLTILAAAILLPELFRLVSEEIGSREHRPRGRNGAIVGLLIAASYLGARFLFHGNAVASLEAHTIAGETPHRVAAFPDSTSPFLWHCIAETQSTLNLVALHNAGGEVTYASGVTTLHKPEPSQTLSAAQSSPAAVTFIKFARFPTEGYEVGIGDLKDQATEEKGRTIFADIDLDKNSRVVSSQLQWSKKYGSP